MALYVNGNKVAGSLVIDGNTGGTEPISIVNNVRIGVTANNKAESPVDANNYIDVSGTMATLKRNNSNYHLWVFTPLLEAGKKYAIIFDNITGSDGNFYMEKTSDISVNPIYATRYDTVNHSSTVTNGVVIIPDTSAYYGVAIWSQGTSDIVIDNPLLYEIA